MNVRISRKDRLYAATVTDGTAKFSVHFGLEPLSKPRVFRVLRGGSLMAERDVTPKQRRDVLTAVARAAWKF